MLCILCISLSCKRNESSEKKDNAKSDQKKNDTKTSEKSFPDPLADDSKLFYEKIKGFFPELDKYPEYSDYEYKIDTRNHFIIMYLQRKKDNETAIWAHIFPRKKGDLKKTEFKEKLLGYPARHHADGFYAVWIGEMEIRCGYGQKINTFATDKSIEDFLGKFNLKELEKYSSIQK